MSVDGEREYLLAATLCCMEEPFRESGEPIGGTRGLAAASFPATVPWGGMAMDKKTNNRKS